MKSHLFLLVCLVALFSVNAKLPRELCTIIKNQDPIPPVCVIMGMPERAELIVTRYFDSFQVHTDFRGFVVYTGEYEGTPLCVANSGLGSAAMTFLTEELIAHDVQVLINLGTGDDKLNSTDPNHLKKCFLMHSYAGLVGVMADYGVDPSRWGERILADALVTSTLAKYAKADPNVILVDSDGYNTDAFYSFLDPDNVAANATRVREMIQAHEEEGARMRDMESNALFFLGQLRHVRTAAVEQAVKKVGLKDHAKIGTVGIPFTLKAMKELMEKYYS